MKRKRTLKMTTAELLAAGHTEAASHLRKRLKQSMKGRPKFQFARQVRQNGSSFYNPATPPPEAENLTPPVTENR